jgi:hypothetical protein
MHDVLGKMPHEWQLQIISHLSMMKELGTSICLGCRPAYQTYRQ